MGISRLDKLLPMKTKPIFFSSITLFCLFEPVAKLVYFKTTTHFPWETILSNLMSRDTMADVFNFWLIFPLAGLTLLKIRSWSYVLFLSLMSYNVYSLVSYEAYTWPYNEVRPHVYNLALTLCCLGIIIAFMFPRVRKPFFDRRSRWWEPQKRHNIFLESELKNNYDTMTAVVSNISATGAYLLNAEDLWIGEHLLINFRIMDELFTTEVVVVRKVSDISVNGYGVKFLNMSFQNKRRLAEALKVWEQTHAPMDESSKQLAS